MLVQFLNRERDGSYFSNQLTTRVNSDSATDFDNTGAFGAFVSEVPVEAFVAAKPLIADRIVFGDLPAFNPRPFMDDVTLRLYDDPDSNVVQDAANVAAPKVSVRATLDEKLSLYHVVACYL